MRAVISQLQLGPCRALAFDQGAPEWGIVLPGAAYSGQAPLLWYARRAAQEAGRNVLVVTDAFDGQGDDPLQWVAERTEAALDHLRSRDAHPLLIAKSLTSLAAPIAAQEGLPAVWLTPLIAGRGTTVADHVLAGLRAATAPALLIGGSEDPSWDGQVAAELSGAEILELPDADHSLEVPDDLAKSLDHLNTVTQAIARFVRALRPQPPR